MALSKPFRNAIKDLDASNLNLFESSIYVSDRNVKFYIYLNKIIILNSLFPRKVGNKLTNLNRSSYQNDPQPLTIDDAIIFAKEKCVFMFISRDSSFSLVKK